MKNPSEILQRIKKVEASPFLLTRIQQKIKDAHEQQVGKFWYRTALATFIVLLCVNIYAIRNINVINTNKSDRDSVFEDMNLIDNNNLYFHE